MDLIDRGQSQRRSAKANRATPENRPARVRPCPQPCYLEYLEHRLLLSGVGLYGTYFAADNLLQPALLRTDAAVDFSWGTGTPDAAIAGPAFSAHWEGQIQSVEAGSYLFRASVAGGERLWVNGQLLIDNWTTHSGSDMGSSITQAANQR